MAKRAEWDVDRKNEHEDFTVELLGGAWTKDHLGVEYDAFRGYARRGDPEEFCVRTGLQKSFRCTTRSVPEETAFQICTEGDFWFPAIEKQRRQRRRQQRRQKTKNSL